MDSDPGELEDWLAAAEMIQIEEEINQLRAAIWSSRPPISDEEAAERSTTFSNLIIKFKKISGMTEAEAEGPDQALVDATHAKLDRMKAAKEARDRAKALAEKEGGKQH